MEPYFYCSHGGIAPVCSDCKRNHNNSSYKTKDIDTWFVGYPSTNGKRCIDYIKG